MLADRAGPRKQTPGSTYVMRSLRSLAFFRPPKAILVPGMYFLGFSRYSNCEDSQSCVVAGPAEWMVHTRDCSFHSTPACLLASV